MSTLSSLCILAALEPAEDGDADVTNNIFAKLSVLPSVTQKIQESMASDRPGISRPAREARELLRTLGQ